MNHPIIPRAMLVCMPSPLHLASSMRYSVTIHKSHSCALTSLRPWRSSRTGRNGFTLVELMVVMVILVVLSAMLMPMIGEARRSSMRTQTQSIMGKTESALRQFKSDFRGYPYQISYADISAGESWTNTLNYNLGTTITATDAANVRADMQAAAGDYSYVCTNYVNGWGTKCPVGGSKHAFKANRNDGLSANDYNNPSTPDSDVAPIGAWQPNIGNNNQTVYLSYDTPNHALGGYNAFDIYAIPICVLLNRMAAERASDLMAIGDIYSGGVIMPALTYSGLTHPGRDLSGTPLVATPASTTHPGWATDYLQGEIDSAHIKGTAILDAWLHPLIYVSQVVPGCEPCCAEIFSQSINIGNTSIYGLQASGRKGLEPCVPGTSVAITGDAYLPDITDLMHSDRRFWSAPGLELEFELWSAGPDGMFSWWRDDETNKDNVSCEPYDKNIGIQP
jgi:prepilin-type N-terminal cleavage/methylation domain-containing protein